MNKFHFIALLAVLGFSFAIGSCVRKDFDAPADNSGYDPGLKVTHTIAQLKAMNGPYVSTTNYPTTTITEDVIVAGIVVADDRSGNFYKQIVIQDSTGGMAININAYSLYAHYPAGRKLYIKCKGLTLGYDGGTPQLGKGINPQKQVNMIESTDIDAHIIRANIGNFVKDTVITLAQARAADPYFYNRLVTVADVEFLDSNKQYTDSAATTNRYLVNCALTSASTTLTTRNSNYSNFHTLFVPKGHGSVTGIFTVYQTSASNKTGQIILRDTSDVKLRTDRCNPFANSVFLESFTSGTSNTDIALTGWTNYAETGGVKWKFGTGGTVANKPYAQVSAFGTTQASVVSWLITPGISLAGIATPKFSFINADGYDNGATLRVFISTNYVPGNAPSSATWTTLNPTISSGNSSGYGAFISSGKVDLTAYTGQTVYIAFKYIGADPASGTKTTTTFEIDDVNISKN